MSLLFSFYLVETYLGCGKINCVKPANGIAASDLCLGIGMGSQVPCHTKEETQTK